MKIWLIAFLLSFTGLAQAKISDIQNYEWRESINYLIKKGIVEGYGDNTYRPNTTINRAEFVKIVMASAYEDDDQWEDWGESCFTDVSSGQWFASYVCAAQTDGIINGYPDGSFKPAAPVNQAEALKIIYETFYGEVEDTPGTWYQKYLDAAEFDGLLYFAPENPASHPLTRGQMAYFMAWVLDEDGELTDEIAFKDFYGKDYQDTDFGWEAMTSEECFADEYFDEIDQQCYVLEDDFDFTDDETFFSDDDFAALAYTDHGHDSTVAGDQIIYRVVGNTITLSQQPNSTDTLLINSDYHELIWQRFARLIPLNNRTKITELVFVNNAKDSTAAYVEPINDDLNNWRMGVNLDDTFNADGQWSDAKEFDLTLIHEFAHVMTLNNSQVDADIEEESCRPQFHTGEGCARQNAFINLFFKKFWTRNMYQAVTDDDEFSAENLYEQKPNSFVTDYAATNPGEDIAETFAYFVAQAKPSQCDQNQKTQKLCFFYEFPSLVTLRKNIRASLK